MNHRDHPGPRPPSGINRRSVLAGGVAAAAGLLAIPDRSLAQPAPAPGAMAPPAPRDATVEVLHGVRIPDPFRAFENPDRPDVQAWIRAQDDRARGVLESNPLHARITAFLRQAGKYSRSSALRRVGRSYFSFAFDGVSEQRWLEVRERPDGAARMLLNPNSLSADGATSLGEYFPDRFGTKIAYLTADAGGDRQVLRIRDVRTGLDLLDRLEGCRFTSVAWLLDGNAFYYTRPPLPSESTDFDPHGHIVFRHQLGYPQQADRVMFRFRLRPNVMMRLRTSYTTNQLMISARVGTSEKSGYFVAPLADASLAIMVLPLDRCAFFPIRNVGPAHYAVTDLDAPKGRIVRVALIDPRPMRWRTIVPEGDGVIDGARMLANRLVVRHFKDLGHRLSIHDLEGAKLADVAFAAHSRVLLAETERDSNDVYLEVDDRRRPTRLERLDVTTGKTQVARASTARHDLSDIEIRQDAATAPDGTKIPVTLMHLPGLAADGSNRTLLYGYGGFAISQWPAYSSLAAAWVRLGGVFAVAHIRGGGEFGRAWHDAARGRRRQHGFDDFRTVAQWLIKERLTRPDRLGIFGASNGGLLVLASMLQHPELYGAVVSGVPVADMLRFHKHTFGTSWKAEYGDPEQAEDFKALFAYSPLHNVKADAKYPPLLILTADNDQRVVPAHAYKMAATLQSLAPAAEVYVRTRTRAGHRGGNAHSKGIEYQADLIAFLAGKLGGPLRELPKLDA